MAKAENEKDLLARMCKGRKEGDHRRRIQSRNKLRYDGSFVPNHSNYFQCKQHGITKESVPHQHSNLPQLARTFAWDGSDGRNELKMVEEWNPETETWTRVRGLKVERDTYGMVAASKDLICPK